MNLGATMAALAAGARLYYLSWSGDDDNAMVVDPASTVRLPVWVGEDVAGQVSLQLFVGESDARRWLRYANEQVSPSGRSLVVRETTLEDLFGSLAAFREIVAESTGADLRLDLCEVGRDTDLPRVADVLWSALASRH